MFPKLENSQFFMEKPVFFFMLLLLDSGVSWECLEHDGVDCGLEKCRVEKIGYNYKNIYTGSDNRIAGSHCEELLQV